MALVKKELIDFELTLEREALKVGLFNHGFRHVAHHHRIGSRFTGKFFVEIAHIRDGCCSRRAKLCLVSLGSNSSEIINRQKSTAFEFSRISRT